MDKRQSALIQFESENANVIAAHIQYLENHPIIIKSDNDAVRKVKQYFPTFDDSDTERLKKGAIIRYLREQQPYKEAFEKECRRQWLKQSIDIYQMLLDSNRLESELRSGLKFDPVEDKAHSEFYVAYFKLLSIPSKTMRSGRETKVSYTTSRHSSTQLDKAAILNKVKWAIVDIYQDQVEI